MDHPTVNHVQLLYNNLVTVVFRCCLSAGIKDTPLFPAVLVFEVCSVGGEMTRKADATTG